MKYFVIAMIVYMFSAICMENIELREQLRVSKSIISVLEYAPTKSTKPHIRKTP